MKQVKHILETKPENIFSVSQETSVLDALKIMLNKNISALLIMDDNTLQGIFTERDYARKIILQGKSSKDTPMKEVMTSDLKTISPNDTIDHCMQIMSDLHIRHLPVIDGGKVKGMVSIGDVVKFIISDQKQTIAHLQSYIQS